MRIEREGGFLDQSFRQSRANQIQLSQMADTKATMLMSISSLVITLSVGNMNKPEARDAALVMMVFCVGTVLLAAYSAMPKVGTFLGAPAAPPDVSHSSFNIFFFGDAVRLSREEYAREMEIVLNNSERVYEIMAWELYNSAQYLANKKYRYLRYAYVCFVTGLISGASVMVAERLTG